VASQLAEARQQFHRRTLTHKIGDALDVACREKRHSAPGTDVLAVSRNMAAARVTDQPTTPITSLSLRMT
jgi:hypothetical protein